jgi:hypothetical protein
MHDRAIDFGSWPADNVELVEKLDDSELGCSILISISYGNVPL